jgi:hypothetical protein
MRGVEDIWGASVTLSYRITYEVSGETLVLRRIGTHDILRRERIQRHLSPGTALFDIEPY